MDQDSVRLLAAHRDGDPEAAEEIFQRYAHRLLGLVRTKLPGFLNSRLDPEDVVQSAFRSFFRHTSAGRYPIDGDGELWRLLAAIAVNKARSQIKFHTAAKRDATTEQARGSSVLLFDPAAVTDEPGPEEGTALLEELEAVLDSLELPIHRRMVELRLLGNEIPEIAEDVGRSERSVRRVLSQMRTDLEERLRPPED